MIRPDLDPLLARMPVGITTADDREVVAKEKPDRPGALTNYLGGQVIYSESWRARRVWIPQR